MPTVSSTNTNCSEVPGQNPQARVSHINDEIRATPGQKEERDGRASENDSHTKVLREETFHIVTGRNSTTLLRWRDGPYSVHTRLPDLDGLGMRDQYFQFTEAGYREAVRLFEQRKAVLDSITTVRAWKEDDDPSM